MRGNNSKQRTRSYEVMEVPLVKYVYNCVDNTLQYRLLLISRRYYSLYTEIGLCDAFVLTGS